MEEIGKTIAMGIADNAVGVIKNGVATAAINGTVGAIQQVRMPALPIPTRHRRSLSRMRFSK